MDFVYFDEIKNGPQTENYYLCSVIVPEAHIMDFGDRVEKLATRYFGCTERTKGTEIHACPIVQGTNNFKKHDLNQP